MEDNTGVLRSGMLAVPILPDDVPCRFQEDVASYKDFETFSLIISAFIIVILSFLEQRSEHSILTKCGRRPALIYPVNMLDHGCDNFGYAMAFGSVTSHCFQLFTGTNFTEGPAWSRTLFVMMYVLVIGLMFYPFFACLTTSWVFVGSILGLGYTALWLYINFSIVIRCPNGADGSSPGQTIAVQIPVLICLLGLFLRFSFLLIRQAARSVHARSTRSLIEQHQRKRLGTKYNVQYVKDLLLPRCSSNGDNSLSNGTNAHTELLETRSPPWYLKARMFLRQQFYRNDPTFKYSPRVVCIFTVSLICAYQFGIIILLVTYQVQKAIPEFFGNSSDTNTSSSDHDSPVFQLKLLQHTIDMCVAVSFSVSSILTLTSIFHILTNYRRNMKLLYKGQSKHLPFQLTDRHPIFVLSDSLSYSGSQVAYILWGFLIVFVVMFLVCIALAYLLVLPIFNLIPRAVLQFIWNFIPGVLILQVVYILQKLFSRGLLQSRESLDTNGKTTKTITLAINNRKVYHNISYFLFFFYIVLGLFGCFLTILKGVVLGVVYLARMDKCGLLAGFETWDRGYMYYVSFLHLEVSHRHPVLLVFCDILLDVQHKHHNVTMTQYASTDITNSDTTYMVDGHPHSHDAEHGHPSQVTRSYRPATSLVTSKRARNRWLKAYTLLRNPGLKSKLIEEEYDIMTQDELEDVSAVEIIT